MPRWQDEVEELTGEVPDRAREGSVSAALRRLAQDEEGRAATGMLVILIAEGDDCADYSLWSLGLSSAEQMAYTSLAAERLADRFYASGEEEAA